MDADCKVIFSSAALRMRIKLMVKAKGESLHNKLFYIKKNCAIFEVLYMYEPRVNYL